MDLPLRLCLPACTTRYCFSVLSLPAYFTFFYCCRMVLCQKSKTCSGFAFEEERLSFRIFWAFYLCLFCCKIQILKPQELHKMFCWMGILIAHQIGISWDLSLIFLWKYDSISIEDNWVGGASFSYISMKNLFIIQSNERSFLSSEILAQILEKTFPITTFWFFKIM